MKFKIEEPKEGVIVNFSFSSKEYCLVKLKEEKFPGITWSLNYLIDRSYKGKDNDIGGEVMLLDDEEAMELIRVGFSYYQ